MKLHKIAASLLMAAVLSTAIPASWGTPLAMTAEAHWHDWYCNGGYYYHGHDAHIHANGICPYGDYVSTASADAAALLAQQQAALLAQQQQAALLAQQQQAALLAQQQQEALLAQQQQAALLLQQQQAAFLAEQQQAALLAQQQQAVLLLQQQQASMILQTQTALKQLGFYNGAVNGIWDVATQQALIMFQASYGLAVDGTINGQIISLFNIH